MIFSTKSNYARPYERVNECFYVRSLEFDNESYSARSSEIANWNYSVRLSERARNAPMSAAGSSDTPFSSARFALTHLRLAKTSSASKCVTSAVTLPRPCQQEIIRELADVPYWASEVARLHLPDLGFARVNINARVSEAF